MKLISLALTAIVGASPIANDSINQLHVNHHVSSSAGGMLAESSPFNRQFQGVISSKVESNSQFNSENQSFEVGNQVAHDHLLNRRLIGGGNPLTGIFTKAIGSGIASAVTGGAGGGGGANLIGKMISSGISGAAKSGGGEGGGGGGAEIFGKLLSSAISGASKSGGGGQSGGGNPLESLTKSMGGAPSGGDKGGSGGGGGGESGGSPLGALGKLISMFSGA